MKYVRHATQGMFLFPRFGNIIHADIGTWLGRDEIVSAGFVTMDDEGLPECSGFSESLYIGSKPVEDTELLRRQLGLVGARA